MIIGYFTKAYGLEHSAFRDAVEVDRKLLGAHLVHGKTIEKDVSLMPADVDIRRLLATTSGYKAIAERGNGPDLFRAAPAQPASLFHPLLVKFVLLMRLGAPWKLGMSHPLAKKACVAAVDHNRDIRLEDPPPKKLGTRLRHLVNPLVERASAKTQFGSGLNGGSTEMTYLAHNAALEAVTCRGLSAASAYVDVAAVFSEVQRCLVIEDMESAQRLYDTLLRNGVLPSLATEIIMDVADTFFGKRTELASTSKK